MADLGRLVKAAALSIPDSARAPSGNLPPLESACACSADPCFGKAQVTLSHAGRDAADQLLARLGRKIDPSMSDNSVNYSYFTPNLILLRSSNDPSTKYMYKATLHTILQPVRTCLGRLALPAVFDISSPNLLFL